MRVLKIIGKMLIKLIVGIVQIPLTIIYFLFSFCGSLLSGAGWIFGVAIFGLTIILWVFGQFDSWIQIVVALGISTCLVVLPGFITDFVGEGVLFLKRALSELTL